MIVLAVDTSTTCGALAVVAVPADGAPAETLAVETFASARSHNAQVFAPLERLLEIARRAGGPHRIVVGTGPGSYTGIRIGIAAAHGVAVACGVPVVGYSSLAALDDAPRYHVIGDARRGGIYHAIVGCGQLCGDPLIHSPMELDALLGGLDAPSYTTDAVPPHPRLVLRLPCAERLARLGAGAEVSAAPVEPRYLRAPYITTPKA